MFGSVCLCPSIIKTWNNSTVKRQIAYGKWKGKWVQTYAVMFCPFNVSSCHIINCYWRFPEDHAQQSVRANLSEEEDGLWQLFLTLPLLLLTRQRCVLLLIIKKTIEQVLVLETQLLVHWRAHICVHIHCKSHQYIALSSFFNILLSILSLMHFVVSVSVQKLNMIESE